MKIAYATKSLYEKTKLSWTKCGLFLYLTKRIFLKIKIIKLLPPIACDFCLPNLTRCRLLTHLCSRNCGFPSDSFVIHQNLCDIHCCELKRVCRKRKYRFIKASKWFIGVSRFLIFLHIYLRYLEIYYNYLRSTNIITQ